MGRQKCDCVGLASEVRAAVCELREIFVVRVGGQGCFHFNLR